MGRTSAAKYRRILLKISGEALGGGKAPGFDTCVIGDIVRQIKLVRDLGVETAVVVGGGNMWRGVVAQAQGMSRATADYAGMLATVINALVLQDALERGGVETRTQLAIPIPVVAEPYIRRRAIRHLEKGRVVIFAAGTGNPYMTTDTAAALRAVEIGADVLLVAKNRVDGIYDSDPAKNPKARKFDRLTHEKALSLRPQIMDATAFSLCLENKLPIIVFDLQAPSSIERVVAGEVLGTMVTIDD